MQTQINFSASNMNFINASIKAFLANICVVQLSGMASEIHSIRDLQFLSSLVLIEISFLIQNVFVNFQKTLTKFPGGFHSVPLIVIERVGSSNLHHIRILSQFELEHHSALLKFHRDEMMSFSCVEQ